jgi:cation transport ATPase
MAAGIFFEYGFDLSPLMSSMAMSLSSVIVVLFSHTLR